jgi:putative colanic acid biosynthesis UDP-glucose lipid carrier transferase
MTTPALHTTPELQRSLLRRRSNVPSLLQMLADFFAVLIIGWQVQALTVTSQSQLPLLSLLAGLLFVVFARQMGLYTLNRNFTRKSFVLVRIWTCVLISLALLSWLMDGLNDAGTVRAVGVLSAGAFLLQLGHNWINYQQQKRDAVKDGFSSPALIIGEGVTANYLNEKISSNPWLAQRVVKIIPLHCLGKTKGLQADLRESDACDAELAAEHIDSLINELSIEVAYIVAASGTTKRFEVVYHKLLERQVAIHWIPDIFALNLINHSVGELAGLPLVTLSETPLTGLRLLAKAIEDRVLGVVLLLTFAPFMLLIAFAIWLDSPGPVFYRQARGGWNREKFRIWKFRTMYQCDADSVQIRQAYKNDPRVTRVGAVLRAASLDELPQLFNVLAGDMSLVGPRPHAISHDTEFSKRIASYMARHHIKPGMTGLAQVRGYRGQTLCVEDMEKRIQSDLEYINQWSVWLDLIILLRTFSVFKNGQAY